MIPGEESAPIAPPTRIETAAQAAAAGGQAEHDVLIRTFLDEVVVVPSTTDPTASAVKPVLVKIDGVPNMVVGDSLDALKDTNAPASYAFSMRGNDVVRGVTPGHALLVRTRMGAFAIDEALLDEIRA